jgi:protein gp37
MNKTKIEWVKNPDGSPGWTWNPLSGCLNHDNGLCKGGGFPCYAYKLANGRLKPLYLANRNYITWLNTSVNFYDDGEQGGQFYKAEIDAPFDPFYPRFWEERLNEIQTHYAGSKHYRQKGIFVCDMSDLFGIGIPEKWTKEVLWKIASHNGHRFYLLTKQAQRLPEFSPFPENCWVGVTATGFTMLNDALFNLQWIKAKVKYISFEPLLERVSMKAEYLNLFGINWLIIGACTGTHRDIEALSAKYPELWGTQLHGNKWALFPKIEWVREIVEAADKAGIPVFLKDNLRPILSQEYGQYPPQWAFKDGELRQELPNG